MKYADLLDGHASRSEMQSFLVGGESVAVTVRIPENLREAAKKAAELNGVSFTAIVKMGLIEYLSKEGR